MRRRALSLLEVTIATFVLATVTVVAMETFVLLSRWTARSQNQLVAGAYAQSLMEEQLAIGFLCRSQPKRKVVLRRGVDDRTSELEMEVSVMVSELGGSYSPTYKKVQVRVEWVDFGVARKAELQSFVSWNI